MDSMKFPNWDKFIYTMIMFLIHTSFGINNSIFGPAFVDFKYMLNTSMDLVSLVSTVSTLGYIIGSLFGFFYKYINRQITLTVLLILMGTMAILVPYSQSLWTLYLCCGLIGLSGGAWNNANNVWLIELWQQKSAPVLQLSQFMYGIGTIFGPLIDRPYLTGEREPESNDTYNVNLTLLSTTSATLVNDDIYRRSKLKIPFLISGIILMIGIILILFIKLVQSKLFYRLLLLGPILMALMFWVKRYETPLKTSNENDNNSRVKLYDRKESPRFLIITIFSILLSFYSISEIIFSEFSATYYQFIALKLTASESAEIVSATALSYTIGRGISIFIAIKIKSQHTIACHFLIIVIATIILFFGQNSITFLWVGSLMMGFGFSSVYGAIFAFIGQYLEITNRIGTILILFSALLNLFMPFILGTFIEKYPTVFVLAIVINLLVSIFFLATVLHMIRTTEKNSI